MEYYFSLCLDIIYTFSHVRKEMSGAQDEWWQLLSNVATLPPLSVDFQILI